MQDEVQEPTAQFEPERLSKPDFLLEILRGIGIASGLALLWVMETVRNTYFRALDRLNVKPRRHRRASAFPPGKPRNKRRESRV